MALAVNSHEDHLGVTSSPDAGSQLNPNPVNPRAIDPIHTPTSVLNQAHLPLNPSLDHGLDLDQVYFTPLFRFGILNNNQQVLK